MKQEISKEIDNCIKKKEEKLKEVYRRYKTTKDEVYKELYLMEWFRLRYRLDELKKVRDNNGQSRHKRDT